jgi:hypothetical protein
MPLLGGYPNTKAVEAWVAGMQSLLRNAAERERVTKNASLRIKTLSKEHIYKQWEQVLAGESSESRKGL